MKRKRITYVHETVTLPAPKAVRPPHTFGYGRVSTSDQSTEMQIRALDQCDQVITDDGISGSTQGASRPGLKKLLEALRPGDTLIVWKLDRLGRSLTDLCNTVKLLDEKGVTFKSLTEGFDMSAPAGKFMFHMLAACAEFERAMIRERVIAGQRNAKINGVIFGRPKKLNGAQLEELKRMRDEGRSYLHMKTVLKIGRTQLAVYLRGLAALGEEGGAG